MSEEQEPGGYRITPEPGRILFHPSYYHFCGSEFLSAEGSYEPPGRYSPVPYYLVCHSIEVLLKAHLLCEGISEKEFMYQTRFGHDLEKGLRWAEETGLGTHVQVTDEERRQVALANAYYMNKEFEYAPPIGKVMEAYRGLPDLETLRSLTVRLRDGLRKPCSEAEPPEEEMNPPDDGGDA
jgi:hypothetical protein